MMLYLSQQSWLHRLSAGFKLILLAGVATGLTVFAQLNLVLLGFALITFSYASLGGSAIASLRAMRPLFLLILGLFLFQYWTLGLASAALITLRMLSLILLAQLVTLTTRLEDLMQALIPLLRPLKRFGVSPARIAFAIALVIRFIPVLLAQYGALRMAWRARGGHRRPWVLLSPLLIQSLQMTEQVALAIAARGGIPEQLSTGKSHHE
jgi:biotin transport system permease protein